MQTIPSNDQNFPQNPTPATTIKPIELLDWLAQDLSQVPSPWHIHKAQISDALISQHEPMKVIYHYENLDDSIKAAHPLNGVLLKQFDRLVTREAFAELLNLAVAEVAKPWQLKFMGKLVVFTDTPEVAVRLHWTNTLKPFEPVYTPDLTAAVLQAFSHWQLVDSVEVISKNPNVMLTATHDSLIKADGKPLTWQAHHLQQFEPLPSPIALQLQKILYQAASVQQDWLPRLQALAVDYVLKDSQQ